MTPEQLLDRLVDEPEFRKLGFDRVEGTRLRRSWGDVRGDIMLWRGSEGYGCTFGVDGKQFGRTLCDLYPDEPHEIWGQIAGGLLCDYDRNRYCLMGDRDLLGTDVGTAVGRMMGWYARWGERFFRIFETPAACWDIVTKSPRQVNRIAPRFWLFRRVVYGYTYLGPKAVETMLECLRGRDAREFRAARREFKAAPPDTPRGKLPQVAEILDRLGVEF